jgi:ABC-type lipoprotein release transport system permease subunit
VLAMGDLLGRIVYRASPYDAVTLVTVAFIVAIVGTLACWLPARRALRVTPASALYAE